MVKKAGDTDYGDLRIVPGFMDVHCHGDYGVDTDDAGGEGLRLLAEEVLVPFPYAIHACTRNPTKTGDCNRQTRMRYV